MSVCHLKLIGVMIVVSATANAADWSHWRGPQRNDIVTVYFGWNGGAWLPVIPLWSRNVGVGSTSPIIVDGRLFTMGWSGNRDVLVCLDDATGLLFTLILDGQLNCWDTCQCGRNVWTLNLYDAFGIPRRQNVGPKKRMLRGYGYTSAPLVWDESVMVEANTKAGTLVAFDKRTGRQG